MSQFLDLLSRMFFMAFSGAFLYIFINFCAYDTYTLKEPNLFIRYGETATLAIIFAISIIGLVKWIKEER